MYLFRPNSHIHHTNDTYNDFILSKIRNQNTQQAELRFSLDQQSSSHDRCSGSSPNQRRLLGSNKLSIWKQIVRGYREADYAYRKAISLGKYAKFVVEAITAFWDFSQSFKLNKSHQKYEKYGPLLMSRLAQLKSLLTYAKVNFFHSGRIWVKLKTTRSEGTAYTTLDANIINLIIQTFPLGMWKRTQKKLNQDDYYQEIFLNKVVNLLDNAYINYSKQNSDQLKEQTIKSVIKQFEEALFDKNIPLLIQAPYYNICTIVETLRMFIIRDPTYTRDIFRFEDSKDLCITLYSAQQKKCVQYKFCLKDIFWGLIVDPQNMPNRLYPMFQQALNEMLFRAFDKAIPDIDNGIDLQILLECTRIGNRKTRMQRIGFDANFPVQSFEQLIKILEDIEGSILKKQFKVFHGISFSHHFRTVTSISQTGITLQDPQQPFGSPASFTFDQLKSILAKRLLKKDFYSLNQKPEIKVAADFYFYSVEISKGCSRDLYSFKTEVEKSMKYTKNLAVLHNGQWENTELYNKDCFSDFRIIGKIQQSYP